MVVAIIGASSDRRKFGNKAVRAFLHRGFDVYPVNLDGQPIEGLQTYRSVEDIPVPIDTVSVYLPPLKTFGVLDEIARKGTRELYLNPGSADRDVLAKSKSLGLNTIEACSIVAIGESPADYD